MAVTISGTKTASTDWKQWLKPIFQSHAVVSTRMAQSGLMPWVMIGGRDTQTTIQMGQEMLSCFTHPQPKRFREKPVLGQDQDVDLLCDSSQLIQCQSVTPTWTCFLCYAWGISYRIINLVSVDESRNSDQWSTLHVKMAYYVQVIYYIENNFCVCPCWGFVCVLLCHVRRSAITAQIVSAEFAQVQSSSASWVIVVCTNTESRRMMQPLEPFDLIRICYLPVRIRTTLFGWNQQQDKQHLRLLSMLETCSIGTQIILCLRTLRRTVIWWASRIL